MKSIFTFLWSSLLACSATAQMSATLSDSCKIRFKMDDRTLQTCNSGSTPTRNGSTITLLGNRIADGFFWERNLITAGSSEDRLWGKGGSLTPPAGAVFHNCPGNWVYFKAAGVNYFPRADASTELLNVYVRIKAFGNERNPDSLRVEFAQNTNVRPEKRFNSAKKDTLCKDYKCVLPDNTVPYIVCPSERVLYPLESNMTNLKGSSMMAFASTNAYDDCSVADSKTYPDHLLNITNGKLVNYHTVAYDVNGNHSICRFQAQFLSPSNDTCFTHFKMELRSTPTCDGASLPAHSFPRISYSIQLLGKRIADGFIIHKGAMSAGSSNSVIFGKKGVTTPPAGTKFINCLGNWTYFTANGLAITARSNTNTELTDRHIRIKHFGQESNPDSLRIEFAEGDELSFGQLHFNTSSKRIDCNKCQAEDKIAPVIQHCPTQIVHYPVSNPAGIKGDEIATFAKIQATDNCKLQSISTYPYSFLDPQRGQIIDFHTVAYDAVGNKKVCQFKIKAVAAPCSVYPKPFLEVFYGMEPVVTAAAGQTCKMVTWKEPALFGNPSYLNFNPVKVTSNYASGHCFPIGVTHVLYTAKDSCGKIDTAGFYVTVKSYNALNAQLKALSNDNQPVTLDIKTLSPNPTDGALLVTLKSLVAKEVTFDFYNTVGSKVYSQTQQVQNGENELFFDVTKLPTGVYFIQTSEQGGKNAPSKFLKY
ncbi:MAG: hypothetical protein RLZZ628_2998 [Bacteroidota bacterium]|jgi:hypothetical protein